MQPRSQVQKRMADHSMLRARERNGIWLENDLYLIKKEIQRYMHEGTKYSNRIILLYRETNGRTLTDKYHFLIDWRGKYIWVVWNQTMQATNTFMPLEALINKIKYMPNSVVGFLMSRKLIDIDTLKKFDVIRVVPKIKTERKEILENNSYWDNHQPKSSI